VSEPKTNRYTSAGPGTARFVAQHLVMKPYMWSALTVHIHGRRNLDSVKAPFIAVANHSSHVDAPLIFGGLPRRLSKNLSAGAASDYFFQSWYKALPTTLFFNSFPVERQGSRGRRGMAGVLLNESVPLLIFPEGTRSRTGAMARFTAGAFALSISRNAPILPIALVGAYAAMPYGATVPVTGRPPVHLVFGRPLRAAPGEIAHQFAERVSRYVVEMHDATARAYGMPTQADFHRAVALRTAAAERVSQDRQEPLEQPVAELIKPQMVEVERHAEAG
jgi:1-acyl-sn-glycerol-3-phosphate acyltransferase